MDADAIVEPGRGIINLFLTVWAYIVNISSTRHVKAGYIIALRENPYKPRKDMDAGAIIEPGPDNLNLIVRTYEHYFL